MTGRATWMMVTLAGLLWGACGDPAVNGYVSWLQATASSSALLSIPMADAANGEPTVLPDMPGYTVRIAPTATDKIFLGVWVQREVGAREIAYRLYLSP